MTNPVEGIIVQHVTRTFAVTRVSDGAALSGSALDTYVTDRNSSVNGTETDYYELWTVSAGGVVSDGGEDTFGLCSLIPGAVGTRKDSTKGTFTMKGTADFYRSKTDGPTLARYGFTKGAVKSAGGLYSTTSAPSNLPASAGSSVTYTVKSAWNSTSTDAPWSTVT